jgi:lipopolysaccharide heptosyltransferase II
MTKSNSHTTLDEYGYPQRPDSRRSLRNFVVHGSRRIVLLLLYIFMSGFGLLLQIKRGKRRYRPLTPHTFHPRRILLIRMDLIGDLVMSLPALRVLKRTYPEAEFDLLALPSSASVVQADPDLSRIFTFDPNKWRRPQALVQPQRWLELWQLRHRLKARHYDLAVSLYGNVAAMLAVLSGARRSVGYTREGYPGFLTDGIAGKHWDVHDHKHEVDYCLMLAEAAGATITPSDRLPELHVSEQTRQEVVRLLTEIGVGQDTPFIVGHVGSNNGQAKRWPLPYWSSLLDKLAHECNVRIILTGVPADQPLIERVMARMQTPAINLAGKTSLTQLAGLMQQSSLVISGDSGPMHIAEAVGAPLISIHGPTDPALSGPIDPQAVIRSDIWCSPCYTTRGPAECRFHTVQCMKDVTPERVFALAKRLLTKRTQLLHNSYKKGEM